MFGHSLPAIYRACNDLVTTIAYDGNIRVNNVFIRVGRAQSIQELVRLGLTGKRTKTMRRQTEQSSSHSEKGTQTLKPEGILVWGLPLLFGLHLLDEILMNGGFVFGVQSHIWPAYDSLRFGLVNAAFFLLISLSGYLYGIRPNRWIVLPLFWLWERTWNGLWHIVWTFIWKEYSPGLATSFLFGLTLLWFLIQISSASRLTLRISVFVAAVGLVFEATLISTLFILR